MILSLSSTFSVLLVPGTGGECWFSIRMLYAGHKILLPFNTHLQGESIQLSQVLLDSGRQCAVPPGLLPGVAAW